MNPFLLIRPTERSLARLISSYCLKCRCQISTGATQFQNIDGATPVDSTPDVSEIAARPPLPILTSRKLNHMPANRPAKQAWLETLGTIEDEKLGIVDLHPDIFATFPRTDLIQQNIKWQQRYRKVDYRFTRNRAEMPGGGRKPWPQKGTGRARHGSIRSPLWIRGGVCHGPRGPISDFYMPHKSVRVYGLRSCLSIKLAQDDLHIVDSLDIPTENPKYIEDLIESRNWGLSVLFIDDTDIMPRSITGATLDIKHFNLMPVYGLNCYSMLKHQTLVLTLAALEKIEEKLLYHMHKTDLMDDVWVRKH
ncbi:large ribosomal subunit protein uL4m-like [Lineus longissimus]|uniref:large ribosomal subunit protein uL4m-like n=1 Tax=Lineus longissimus TaxID=88925 RepID=UPI002B4C80D0